MGPLRPHCVEGLLLRHSAIEGDDRFCLSIFRNFSGAYCQDLETGIGSGVHCPDHDRPSKVESRVPVETYEPAEDEEDTHREIDVAQLLRNP